MEIDHPLNSNGPETPIWPITHAVKTDSATIQLAEW